jgi:hypothetical protein
MGFSGYVIGPLVSITVDAHGGDREERGEMLHEELSARLLKAVEDIIAEDRYREIRPELA